MRTSQEFLGTKEHRYFFKGQRIFLFGLLLENNENLYVSLLLPRPLRQPFREELIMNAGNL